MRAVKLRGVLRSALLAGAAGAIGYAALRSEAGGSVDRELFSAVNAGHGPGADRLFDGVTELGSLYAARRGGGLARRLGRATRRGVTRPRRRRPRGSLGQGVKRLVDRPRPYHADAAGTRKMIASPVRDVVAVDPPGRAHHLHARGGARARSRRAGSSRAHRPRSRGGYLPRLPRRALPVRCRRRPADRARGGRDVATRTADRLASDASSSPPSAGRSSIASASVPSRSRRTGCSSRSGS